MEKTVVGGKIVIALGAICLVIVAALGATIASYTFAIGNKDKANQDYVSTHSHDNNEFNSLNASLNDYMQTHSHTDQEFASAVTAPKLVTVDVTTEDDWSGEPYTPSSLLVNGYVVNAGTDAAYNPKIHVVAYELFDVKDIDAYVTLDTIGGGSWTTFNSTLVYNGGPLVHWTITPQWTTTP